MLYSQLFMYIGLLKHFKHTQNYTSVMNYNRKEESLQ